MGNERAATRLVRFTFKFYAYVTKDVEVPADSEEGDDAFEKAINDAASDIDIDGYAVFEDAQEAAADAELSR